MREGPGLLQVTLGSVTSNWSLWNIHPVIENIHPYIEKIHPYIENIQGETYNWTTHKLLKYKYPCKMANNFYNSWRLLRDFVLRKFRGVQLNVSPCTSIHREDPSIDRENPSIYRKPTSIYKEDPTIHRDNPSIQREDPAYSLRSHHCAGESPSPWPRRSPSLGARLYRESGYRCLSLLLLLLLPLSCPSPAPLLHLLLPLLHFTSPPFFLLLSSCLLPFSTFCSCCCPPCTPAG